MSLGNRAGHPTGFPYHSPGYAIYPRPSATGRSTVPHDGALGYGSSMQLGVQIQDYPRRDLNTQQGMYAPRHQAGATAPTVAFDVFGPGAIGQERGQVYQPHHKNNSYSPQRRGQSRFGNRHNHDFTSGHHNVVDVERIRRGLDVRTTVSLLASFDVGTVR